MAPPLILRIALRRRPTPRTRNLKSILAAIKVRFARKQKNPRSEASVEEEEDTIGWDVPNPFSPPDPELAYVHALIQGEITQMRQFESGPLDHVIDEESESEESDSGDDEYDDEGVDADDEGDSEDNKSDEDDEDKLAPIALPRLLPIPLRFIHTDDESTSPSPPRPSFDENDHPTQVHTRPFAPQSAFLARAEASSPVNLVRRIM